MTTDNKNFVVPQETLDLVARLKNAKPLNAIKADLKAYEERAARRDGIDIKSRRAGLALFWNKTE